MRPVFSPEIMALAANVPADAPRPRVYIEVWSTPPMAAGLELTALVRLLGGEPFLAPPSHGDLQVSWEELMEFDPQLVIYAVKGKGLDTDPGEFFKIEGWDRTEAAVAKRVYSLDDSLFYSTDTKLFEGAQLLQALMRELFWGGTEKYKNKLIKRVNIN